MTPRAPHIRYMARVDLPACIAIDRTSNVPQWSARQFLKILSERKTIGLVISVDSVITGFLIYTLSQHHLRIDRMAVATGERLQGHGRMLIDKLKRKAETMQKRFVETELWEYNEAGILFLFRCGFRTDGMTIGTYPNGSDGIRMVSMVDAGVTSDV